MMVVLGVEDLLVGTDEKTLNAGNSSISVILCPEILELPTPCSNNALNMETLLALNPDLVLVGGVGGETWIAPLRNANLTVLVVDFEEIGNFTRDLAILGEALNVQTKATQICTYLQSVLNDVDTRVGNLTRDEKVSASACSNTAYKVYGNTAFENAVIVTAGGINVAENMSVFRSQVSAEQLLVWNPDAMFIEGAVVTVDDVMSDPLLQDVAAAQTGAIYLVPEANWFFGSLRSIFAIEWMSSKLYPTLYSDVNMLQAANAFWTTVYGINYTGPWI